jgi:3-oxoadipate enol-lactonase
VELLRTTRTRGPDFARRIACPVLAITGALDYAICPAGVHLVTAQMPNARVAEVPATGHSVYFERAAIFNATLREFLDGIGC